MRRVVGLGGADADRREALLEELIEESQRFIGSQASSLESKILSNIVDLRDRTAYDVAVPRADIAAVSADTRFTDLISAFHGTSHSRLPVYAENLDDVLGMVHIKDVIGFVATGESFDLRAILRDVLFVAPSMRVTDLLVKMQIARIHMAVVVDEFGGIDGLVTIEDLVETIVGEIEDEHDVVDATAIVDEPDGTILVDARVPIEMFESRVGPLLTEAERAEDIDTLGGLVFHLAGRVPSRGELLGHASGVAFEVADADPRRIQALRVRGADQLGAAVEGREPSGIATPMTVSAFAPPEVPRSDACAIAPSVPAAHAPNGDRRPDPSRDGVPAPAARSAKRRETTAAAKTATAKSASRAKSNRRRSGNSNASSPATAELASLAKSPHVAANRKPVEPAVRRTRAAGASSSTSAVANKQQNGPAGRPSSDRTELAVRATPSAPGTPAGKPTRSGPPAAARPETGSPRRPARGQPPAEPLLSDARQRVSGVRERQRDESA